MTREGPCLLYSQDADLVRRVTAFLRFAVTVSHLDDPGELRQTLNQAESSVLLFDVRGTDARQLMPELQATWPHTLVIAFAQPRSDPFRQAREMGAYAVEDIQFDGRELQFLVERAMEHLYLSESVRLLRESVATANAVAEHATTLAERKDPGPSLRNIFPPLRHATNVEALLHGIVDSIARAAFVLRAGVFVRMPGDDAYRMKAGMGCRNTMHGLAYIPNTEFVKWLEINAQIVSRSGLHHVTETEDRLVLGRALDAMGAELIAPLHGRQSLIGWVFFGRKATGADLYPGDYQDVMLFAEHAAMAIENAILYEEVRLQKTFAETLLQSMPTGIVAAGEDGTIRWFNRAAQKILRKDRDDTLGQSVDVLNGTLGDRMRRTLQGEQGAQQPFEWQLAHANAHLATQILRLMNEQDCLGAVALVQDLTKERALAERQQAVERAEFWTDLAAGMSHEIRNPLVAIKTFAQLLPERYDEEEFRAQFSKVVTQEVDRLNRIIEQINEFAHLPESSLAPVDIGAVVADAVSRANSRFDASAVALTKDVPAGLPQVQADAAALADGMAHILINAFEAVTDTKNPHVEIAVAHVRPDAQNAGRIAIRFTDNGPGIQPALRDRVFFPFCTGKVSGMGLGLPIAQRIITDHGGRIRIQDQESGTTIVVELPTAKEGRAHETPADC